MSRNGPDRKRSQLRELASRTLEAYRTLNSAAAEASYVGSAKPPGNSLARASELLEGVVTEIKGTSRDKDT